MDIFAFISLFGGLALFLYGMQIMSDGLKKCSGSAMKNVLEKMTSNVLLGFLLGALITAVIQSSAAVIVIMVGLIGAGMLNLRQAINVVIGANVGTTVTAQIIRLLDIDSSHSVMLNFFKPSTLAPLAAIVGVVLIMFFKRSSARNVGEIAIGFGVLFIGLLNMTSAVEPLQDSPIFINAIQEFASVPILGLILGTVATTIVQSSSATTGMLQALSTTGLLTFGSVYSVIFGINIGTCIATALVSGIGAKPDAKRIGIVHISFNLIGTIVIMSVMELLHSAGLLTGLWSKIVNSGDIANFHTFLNVATAVMLLPFTRLLEKLAYLIIKDKPSNIEEESAGLELLDDNFFMSPVIALSRAEDVVCSMGNLAAQNFADSVALTIDYDESDMHKIITRENHIDRLADGVNNYLVNLSSSVEDVWDNKTLNFLLQTFTDFERIGDYAMNISEHAEQMQKDEISFSDSAKAELEVLSNAIKDILNVTITAFKSEDTQIAKQIEPLEEVIDDIVATLQNRHIERLKQGSCSVNTGVVFLDMLSNIERIADHCSNIAIFIMGKYEITVLLNQHKYKEQLHIGQDPEYIKVFKENSEKYIGAIQAIPI